MFTHFWLIYVYKTICSEALWYVWDLRAQAPDYHVGEGLCVYLLSLRIRFEALVYVFMWLKGERGTRALRSMSVQFCEPPIIISGLVYTNYLVLMTGSQAMFPLHRKNYSFCS